MLNAAALFKCALKAICGLYLRYKPDVGAEEMSFGNTQGPVRYSKLQQPETTKISKFYDMLPSYLKKAKVTMTTSDVRNGGTTRKRAFSKSLELIDNRVYYYFQVRRTTRSIYY